MKRHTRRKPGDNRPCLKCLPDLRYKLLPVDEIMDLPTTDDQSYSLKVYVAAFSIGMQEYMGSPDSIEAQGLLAICEEEISRGHRIVIRLK